MAATTEETVRREQEAFERGESLEDEAAAKVNGDGDETEDDGTPQLVLPGTGKRLSTNVGGRKPTESRFKTRAISLPISGNAQIDKDETVWVAIEFAIDDVRIKNHREGRDIKAVTLEHVGVPLGAPVILDGPPGGVSVDDS